MDFDVLIGTDEISIHALREEGDLPRDALAALVVTISIHALREEGDLPRDALAALVVTISIHALREEGDYSFDWCFSSRK